MKRKELIRWLKDNGFEQAPGKAGGHLHFVKEGVKVTVAGHGKADVSAKHLALLARHLSAAGLGDAAALKRAWGLR